MLLRQFVRFAQIPATWLIAALLSAASISLSTPSRASAEEFLVCKPERKLLAQEGPAARERLRKHVKEILHDLAGDDLSAYFGATPAVLVIPERSPNAFVTAVDEIVLSTGLLSAVGSTDELAFVLAHEMGHVALHHSRPNYKAQLAFTGQRNSVHALISHEVEADRFAVRLLMQSGYEPRAGLELLTRLQRVFARQGSSALRSYPSLDTRIAALDIGLSSPLCGIR